jgi:ankyrin repeat protein
VTPHTVNIQCGKYSNSALHFVIWHGRYSGESNLHRAYSNSNIKAVNALLYTDDVSVQDNGGNTPLHRSCQFGDVDIVESLLSVFANTIITNDYKRTPAELANYVANSELEPCFSQLLPWPADTATNVTTSVSVTQSTSGIVSITDVTISK